MDRLTKDISKTRDAVAALRSQIQIRSTDEATIERQLEDVLMQKADTAATLKRRSSAGQPIDQNTLKELRDESERLITLIHQAEDAVRSLCDKLK